MRLVTLTLAVAACLVLSATADAATHCKPPAGTISMVVGSSTSCATARSVHRHWHGRPVTVNGVRYDCRFRGTIGSFSTYGFLYQCSTRHGVVLSWTVPEGAVGP